MRCIPTLLCHAGLLLGTEPPVLGLAIDGRAVVDLASGQPIAQASDAASAAQLRLAVLRARHGEGRWNVPVRTVGGLQYWADRCWMGGWRIQENAWTGHCRLLSPTQVRCAWGDFAACRIALEERRLAGEVPRAQGDIVVLVHGVWGFRGRMATIARALEARGCTVARISYPSSRAGIETHAEHLREIIAQFGKESRVSFVAHSLGSLVVREALSKPGPDWPQLGKAVFLFPPSRGACRADAWQGNPLYRLVMGPVGRQLTTAQAASIPMPTLPFAIVAGTGGSNRRIPGPDDGTVGLLETWLPGAERWDLFPVRHSSGLRDPQVVAMTCDYITDINGRAAD